MRQEKVLRSVYNWSGPSLFRACFLGRLQETLHVFAFSFLIFVACDSSNEKLYNVRGVVESVRSEDAQVIISHEEVPDLMSAMTMNFDIASPSLLAGLNPGDEIEFELLFNGRAYVIQSITKIGEVSSNREPLKLASLDEFLPSFTLVNQRGEMINSRDFEQKVLVLDFIYTNCPGPCPVSTSVGVSVRHLLEDIKDNFVFCSISLDPSRDTPEALSEYAKARGAEFDNWQFLTGDLKTIEELVSALGVARIGDSAGEFEHTLVRFLVDGKGRIRNRLLGAKYNPEEISRTIRRGVASFGQK